MTEPFTCSGRISKMEFAWISMRGLSRENARTSWISRIYLAIMLLVLGINFYKSWRIGFSDLLRHDSWSIALNWALVGMVLLAIFARFFDFWRDYSDEFPDPDEGYTFEFYPDRFKVRSADYRSEVEWRDVKKLVTVGRVFVFRMGGGRTSFFLNVRHLSPEQLEYIRNSFVRSRRK